MTKEIYLEEFNIKVNVVGKSNITILKALKIADRSISWLADEINMSRHTLNYKLKNNTVSGDELLEISKILNINLEELKIDEEIKKIVKDNIKVDYELVEKIAQEIKKKIEKEMK